MTRGALAVAMLLALLMRVAVPAGFMPTHVGGKIIVELCTGTGAATMALDFGKDAPTPADKHKAGDSPCAFSGGFAGGLIDTIAPALLAPMLVLAPLVTRMAIADLTVHRLAAPPPPAIGPPRSR